MKTMTAIWPFVVNEFVPAAAAILLIVGILTCGWQAATWSSDRAGRVDAAVDVGLPLSHQVTADSWSGPEMSVETERGFFHVAGSMELLKDLPMKLETRGDHTRWLCQGVPKTCSHILGAPGQP